MPIRAILLIALVLVGGAGCGRRGDLEAPPGTAVDEPAPGSAAVLDTASPGAQEPPAVRPGDAAPQSRFFLDPLI